jgi:CRP-like cAMP-binding protein
MSAEISSKKEVNTVKAGEWLITESNMPSYYIYRLLEGAVDIYEEHEKINHIEVNPGDEPKTLGFLSALSYERRHTASVKTVSDIKVEMINTDHIRGLLHHDVPEAIRNDIDIMIETIVIGDRIKSHSRQLSKMPAIELTVEKGLDSELAQVLTELKILYQSILHDSECTGGLS